MKKKLCFLFLLLFFICFHNYGIFYKNPFWTNDFKKLNRLRIENFTLDYIRLSQSNIIFFKDLFFDGVYVEHKIQMSISKAFIFENTNLFEYNTGFNKVIKAGFTFYPLSFFKFSTEYLFCDFSNYNVFEHNLRFNFSLIYHGVYFVEITHKFGVNLRFVDLNIHNNNTLYNVDWLFFNYFMLQGTYMFHPVNFTSFGVSFGNIPENNTSSQNFWQLEIINYYHLPEHISVYMSGGFSLAGSLPFAGNINNYWFKIGGIYEIH